MAAPRTILCVLVFVSSVFAVNAEFTVVKSSAGVDALFSQKDFVGRRTEGGIHLRHVRDSDSASSTDQKCHIEQAKAKAELAKHTHAYNFSDSNQNLAMIWTGKNGKEMMVLSTMQYMFFAAQSQLWISLDFGKSFQSINDRIDGAVIRSEGGIIKSPHDPRKVILVSFLEDMSETQTRLFITVDGGKTFTKSLTPFYVDGAIMLHPTDGNRLLARSSYQEFKLWVSDDFGLNWRNVQKNVMSFDWGTNADEPGSIFVTVSADTDSEDTKTPAYTLMRSTDYGHSFQTIHQEVFSFGVQGKFVFAAMLGGKDGKGRILYVSKDDGKTWNPTQLPVVAEDRFFAVLDMNEGMIFMHVDDIGDSSSGTLYTSDSDGIVFSVSLEKHLFPEGSPTLSDFYRVTSMRGVYMASQVNQDGSIHTMITYDRGGIWQPVKAPKGSTCKDSTTSCSLQIHNKYSMARGINAPSGPLSQESAIGIILANGNVADSLETHPPDVFVSSDGGYNWHKALSGPYQYTITNHGGLLLAIPADQEATNIIKFSYDEGHCWNEYQFYEEPLRITGLIPEPSTSSLNVSIWGFGVEDRMWRVITIDFSAVLTSECTAQDFVEWVPHESNNQKGCLLGMHETFDRVKPDSLCRLSYQHQHKPKKSSQCLCTKDDYECDFGFSRSESSEDCEVSTGFDISHLDICIKGVEDQIRSWGYRKIPGDVCIDGFEPERKIEKLQEKCSANYDTSFSVAMASGTRSAAIVMLLLLVIAFAAGSLFLLHRKNRLPCTKQSSPSYRYSQLSEGDNLDKMIDLESHPTYRDSSDEEMLD